MHKKNKDREKDATGVGETPSSGVQDFATPVEADFSYDMEEEDEGAGSVEETARYIADMVGALAAMAGDARLDLLTYLLNMARVEAELQARQTETADDDED